MCVMLLMVTSCVSGESEDFVTPAMMEAGTEAPDFTITTAEHPEGFTLSSLRGKYVFLEFWASWCPDCRKVNDRVKALHATYESDKLVFVGVSFDRTYEALTEYMAAQQMTWIQQWEAKGMKESPVSIAYGIKWIPTFYLIDPEGKVVKGSIEVGDMETLLKDMSAQFAAHPAQ